MNRLTGRVAGAPISWGVCEVPGWGHQLHPQQVLSEMSQLGLAATEFGPVGFLPVDPAARAELLRAHGLAAVGGFLVVSLHEPGHDPLPEVDIFLDGCVATGAGVLVLAAHTGVEGYDARPELDEAGWATLFANLDRIHDRAHERGVVAALHPHVGTMVERGEHVDRVLAGSRIGLCVDTGHLRVGGVDPVALAEAHSGRVVHVHLKDVDEEIARRVFEGETSFGDAITHGLFRPLGQGDLDVAGLVTVLESAGYDGWYVLEQDVKLSGVPSGEGPVHDVRLSLEFLEAVAP